MAGLTTGQLAEAAGVNLESIRFYEGEGLLPKPPRTRSGYRLFPEDAVRRIRSIKRAQELGFSLKEVKELLSIRLDPERTCDDVAHQVDSKLCDIDRKIASLKAMRRALVRLRASCPGGADASHCAILNALDGDGAKPRRPNPPKTERRSNATVNP